jgi:hypothetical protein
LANATWKFFLRCIFASTNNFDETAGTKVSAFLGPSSAAQLSPKSMILNGLLTA